MEVIETLTNRANTRKVEIYRRQDGTFGFEALKFAKEEDVWIPYGNYSFCICSSAQDAKSEAIGRIEWLS
jgi:hypothetical protein